MNSKNTGFKMFVISFVMLTGAGFGTWAGFAYSESVFWIGTVLGGVSGYIVAKLYLCQLTRICAKGHSKLATWLKGSLIGSLCGIISTTIIHVIMALGTAIMSGKGLFSLMDGFLFIAIGVAEIIGACAGLIVGGICSLVYVLKIAGTTDETTDLA